MTFKNRTEEEIKRILELGGQEIKKNWVQHTLAEKYPSINGEKETVRHCALGAIGRHTPEFDRPPHQIEYADIDFDTTVALAYAIDEIKLDVILRENKNLFKVRAREMYLDEHRLKDLKSCVYRSVSHEVEEIVYRFNDDNSQQDVRDKFSEAIELIPESAPTIAQFHDLIEEITEELEQ